MSHGSPPNLDRVNISNLLVGYWKPRAVIDWAQMCDNCQNIQVLLGYCGIYKKKMKTRSEL